MTTAERSREDVTVDFDVYDPSIAAPPIDRFQEYAAELAAKGPVVYSTAHGGHWIVTSYNEIHEVLRDAETFSSYPPNNLVTNEPSASSSRSSSIRRSTPATARRCSRCSVRPG